MAFSQVLQCPFLFLYHLTEEKIHVFLLCFDCRVAISVL